MKRGLILTFLMLLLSFGMLNAQPLDVPLIDTMGNIPNYTAPYNTEIRIIDNNTVGPYDVIMHLGNSEVIKACTFPFKIYTTGDVAAEFDTTTSHLITPGRWDADYVSGEGLTWKRRYTESYSHDSMSIGGSALPPLNGESPDGVGPCYNLGIVITNLGTIGGVTTDGYIFIDSCVWHEPASGWNLDLGAGNIYPGFDDWEDNGDNTPAAFHYAYIECQAPGFTNDPGDPTANHCNGYTYDFDADPVEPGATITGFALTDGGGLTGDIDGNGVLTLDPADPGTYTVTVSVSNSCPATKDLTFDVEYTNLGFTLNCPVEFDANVGIPKAVNLNMVNLDCDTPIEGITAIGDAAVSGGVFTWTPQPSDEGDVVFTYTVSDGFGEEEECTFTAHVSAGAPWSVMIEKEEMVFQGGYTEVSIYLTAAKEAMGGFDFLLAYDASALTFINAARGADIADWEYFTYRFGAFGNCGSMCPSGMIQILAMLESNNGPNHPASGGLFDIDDPVTWPVDDCADFVTNTAELVKLKFFVTDDRTYECTYVPIYFFWLDCPDNAISDKDGVDLYISSDVYNYNGMCNSGSNFNGFYSITKADPDPDFEFVFGAFAYCDDAREPLTQYTTQLACEEVGGIWEAGACYKPFPLREVAFFNGGVDIACAEEIDDRGDLNLNTVANEVADAVLYTNYFINGLSVFTINLQGQIAASDVNNDGRVLTVGDLVYLIRILTNDAVAFDKLAPFAREASVRFDGSSVVMDAPVSVGAARFVFDGEATITNLTNMDMLADVVDGKTNVLVYNLEKGSINAGINNIISVNGDVTLNSVEISDYYGNEVNVNILAKVVPTDYALHQNKPNPFNPATEIQLDLPESGNYSIDIYNVTGQLVKNFSGYSDAGIVKVKWEANDAASGIYFYKATANNFTDTKKMVLMK
jgi:hypothetical protein